ncbi:NodT family efflux transporter outer membrane factor (OMF) lipoprotein [Neorhizobium galegae]|uniref:efflux transporter outer membrane subunit n=1 Tax=Rhizobium/Agrobacterium group TaxID=227290 RepID=UPI001AE289DA|nr:efflux transporter outer membrane subunit [Neorhizobium galegae]MBP2551701.1 NodT family efflux transporter outer membrane factor (OMF) lipoprotein [Neorhizobium galegae]
MRSTLSSLLSAMAAAATLTGCTSLGDLRPAAPTVASSWHATVPHGGRSSDLLAWWASFKDPTLEALLRLAERENPTVEEAVANIDKARATLDSTRSGLFPSLDGSASAGREGNKGDDGNRLAAGTTKSGGLDAAWELDLFGKTKQQARAASSRVDGKVWSWHDARVSVAAEVGDDYVQYRACRELERLYRDELASQRETVRATERSAGSGLTSTGDLALTRASAAASSSSLTAQRGECEILVKSLTQLTGGDEQAVRRLLDQGKRQIPQPSALRITSVPAEMLRQRPDVNALEAEVVATISDVGAAKADLYPSLSLSGSISISQSTVTGRSVPWSFGPALSVPLLDGGSRRAAVRSSVADYDIAVASYKSGVLSAVAEVETALVRVDTALRRIADARSAADNYQSYFRAVDQNWASGGVSILDREEARRSAQSAAITLIEIRRDAVQYWIALYKALGGGWSAPVVSLASAQGTK